MRGGAGYFFAVIAYLVSVNYLFPQKSLHIGALLLNVFPILSILYFQYVAKTKNFFIPLLLFFLTIISHFSFSSNLWGDSGYYYGVASDSKYRESVGYEPGLLLSAPLASLVMAILMRYAPEVTVYIAPISFCLISLVLFRIFKSTLVDNWYRISYTILFMQSSLMVIFSYSRYIELYVFSNLISFVILLFLLKQNNLTLKSSYLLGLVCLTHLLYLPLWILNFKLTSKLKFAKKLLLSLLSFILAALSIYFISYLMRFKVLRGNLPLEDSVLINTPGGKVGLAATSVFLLISVLQFPKVFSIPTFKILIVTYFAFTTFWNFKLGLPNDLDLVLAPSYIFLFTVLFMLSRNPMTPDRTRLPFIAAIGVVNSTFASFFVS
jgi:hypothetical protein